DKLNRKEITQEQYDARMAALQQRRQGTDVVTKYFTEEERKSAEVSFDEDGTARGRSYLNRDGTFSATEGRLEGPREYVMDTKGQLHQYTNAQAPTGKRGVEPICGQEVDQNAWTHHSSVLAGQEVAGAGTMEFDDQGKLAKITNKSGHYKPGDAQMI